MSTRQIRLRVDGVEAVAKLETIFARMAEAFWQTLPVETSISHAMWTGSAVYYYPGDSPLSEVEDLEYPSAPSIRDFVARPRGSEVMFAYGPAEYRWNIGTDYLTPIAQIDNREAFLAVLARMHDEGDKSISIERVG